MVLVVVVGLVRVDSQGRNKKLALLSSLRSFSSSSPSSSSCSSASDGGNHPSQAIIKLQSAKLSLMGSSIYRWLAVSKLASLPDKWRLDQSLSYLYQYIRESFLDHHQLINKLTLASQRAILLVLFLLRLKQRKDNIRIVSVQSTSCNHSCQDTFVRYLCANLKRENLRNSNFLDDRLGYN